MVKLSVPVLNAITGFGHPKDVENHLKYDGMAVYYLHAPWNWHGEPLPGANMGQPPAPNGDIPAMLHDAFGMHGLSPGPNDDEDFAPPQGLPPDAERFYRLMEEGQTELYPVCGKKKLEFILQVKNMKRPFNGGGSDIPGIVTEKTGITQKIQALKDVYEAQRKEYEKREAEMAKQLKEAAEREEALQANYVALNSKMDAIQGQVGANSLVQILAAAGIGSMESLDFGRLLNLLKKPENSKDTSQTNVQLTSECQDADNGHNGRLCST